MFDRFERGSISWQEIRSISAELGFTNLVSAMRTEAGLSVAAPKLGSKAEDELSFKGFRRLLHSKRVAAQLEKESSHHTASYQYRVLEKVIQMLIHGHIEISDLSEARLAFNFHSQEAWGVPFEHHTLTAALRLAKHALAPDQLQTWMEAAAASGKLDLRPMGDEGGSFIQLYEFLDLFVLCDPIRLNRARVIRPKNPRDRSRRERLRESTEKDYPRSLSVWAEDTVGRARTPHHGHAGPVAADGRWDLRFPQSEHYFKTYVEGKTKDQAGAYDLADDDFLMTPSERLGTALNVGYNTRVKEHRRQLLNDRTHKELQEKYKADERQKLRGNKVAAKEQLYGEIVAALSESSDTVTASRIAFRPAARQKALDRTHRLRQSLSRAGMAPVASSQGTMSEVRRAQSVGSIGMGTGRGVGGTEWGGAMDDTMSGEAKALGVGAPPRDSGAFCHAAHPVLTYAGLRQHRSDLQHVRCLQCRRRGPRHRPRLQVTLHRRQTSSSLNGSNKTCWRPAATYPPASPTRGARRGRREPPATRTRGGARHRRSWRLGQRRLGRRSGSGRRRGRGGVGRAGQPGSPSPRRCRRGRGRCAVPGRMPARGALLSPVSLCLHKLLRKLRIRVSDCG